MPKVASADGALARICAPYDAAVLLPRGRAVPLAGPRSSWWSRERIRRVSRAELSQLRWAQFAAGAGRRKRREKHNGCFDAESRPGRMRLWRCGQRT